MVFVFPYKRIDQPEGGILTELAQGQGRVFGQQFHGFPVVGKDRGVVQTGSQLCEVFGSSQLLEVAGSGQRLHLRCVFGQKVCQGFHDAVKFGEKQLKDLLVYGLVIILEKRPGCLGGAGWPVANKGAFQGAGKTQQFHGHDRLGIHLGCEHVRFQLAVKFLHGGDQGDVFVAS